MKRLLLLAVLLLPVGAQAQQQSSLRPPIEIVAADTVRLSVGQSRTFLFGEGVTEVKLTSNGVVRVIPMTDQEYSIEGIKPGAVMAVVYGQGAKTLHRFNVVVGPPSLVKVYGTADAKGGYTSYNCNGLGCERGNQDVVQGPDRVTVTETVQRPDGGAVSIAKEYR